ncbi:MAG: DUF523 domain-containing protein [Deltaproteobacteria bacterium]|nr:DUF523 domain-containing protein [Deltaproteobacteria bacterium]
MSRGSDDRGGEKRRTTQRRETPVAVSACLVGEPCRFDGQARPLADLGERLGGAEALPLCPEVLAGLGVPRPPVAFHGGDGRAVLAGEARLLRADGRDVTAAMIAGARRAAALIRAAGCRRAILKERSPSCGVYRVHADGELVPGCGLLAALLAQDGVELQTEEEHRSG